MISLLRFLRRHYPDQVRGSSAVRAPLSPATPSSPCYLITARVYWMVVAAVKPGFGEQFQRHNVSVRLIR